MGGANSVENNISLINQSVTNLITTSIKTASTKSTAIQTIKIDCEKFSKTASERMNNCFNVFHDRSLDEIEQICTNFMTCGVNGITMTGAINVNLSADLRKNVQLEVENNINNNIKSIMQQQSGLLQFGNKEINDIKVFTSVVNTLMVKFIQNDFTNMSQTQNISLENVYLRVVSLDAVTNLIQKSIIENSNYQKAVNTISNNIFAMSKQTHTMEGPMQLLFYIVGIAMGGLLILGLILWILRQNKNK